MSGRTACAVLSRRILSRRAFTLVEMLVSLVITLMMMVVVTLFGVVTDSVSGSRAVIEMNERLRAARNRLQADLDGLTVTNVQPPLKPENDEGYFEYIEGPYTDKDWVVSSTSILGDADDALAFTTRSKAEPFIGRFQGSPTQTIDSQTAEVFYFCVANGPIIDATTNPPTRLYTLYRRMLLLKPGLRNGGGFPQQLIASTVTIPGTDKYYDLNDISVHVEVPPTGTPALVPNSLGDLTKPENRFAHYGINDQFPFTLNAVIDTAAIPNRPSSRHAYLVPFDNSGAVPRLGDDVVMTNVLAFDVQIYDSTAEVREHNPSGTPVTPVDPGYGSSGSLNVLGAYVDLGYAYLSSPSQFSASAWQPQPSGATAAPTLPWMRTAPPHQNPVGLASHSQPFVYDTWSFHYEHDGLQQRPGPQGPDPATNGLDDDGNQLVDDITERETLAPFAAKVRGIRIILRCYEPSSRQVRQVTIVQNFLPE